MTELTDRRSTQSTGDPGVPGWLSPGFRSVVFDCDSTLTAVEGVDELAGPYRERVEALTRAAMDGGVPMEAVFGERLALIRPGAEELRRLGELYVRSLVPDAREVVAALRWLGKEVRIVSGGFQQAVEHLAWHLDLPSEAVAAVPLSFAPDGSYAGFDPQAVTARSGGKASAVGAFALPRPTLLVGDGITDAEARPTVDAFAAYMGVVDRPAVAARAEWVLRDPSLAPVLALCADPADRARLQTSRWSELLRRGDLLLSGADPAREARPVETALESHATDAP